MAEGVHGWKPAWLEGHAWLGVCMAGDGVCMDEGGMCGWRVCMAGGDIHG